MGAKKKSGSTAEELLDRKRYAKARSAFLETRGESQAEIRARKHGVARATFREGRYSEALEMLQEIRREHGNHVRLLSNICMCLYHLERFPEWEASFHELLEEFRGARPLLLPPSLYLVSSHVAKTHEEMGEIQLAYEVYQSALASIDAASYPTEYYLLLAQSLRLQSGFSFAKKEAADAYCRLVRLKDSSPSQYIGFEIQHALMVSEIHLHGELPARARLDELLARDDLSEEDKRLCFYDFLEEREFSGLSNEAASTNLRAPAWIGEVASYERFVHALLLGNEGCDPESLFFGLSLSRSLPKAGLIRCVALSIRCARSEPVKTALKRQLTTLLKTLTSRSRSAWQKRLLLSADLSLAVSIVVEGTALSFGERRLELSRYPSLLQFLRLFSNQRAWSNDSIAMTLWEAHYNPSFYHRIRVASLRLNQIIFELSGLPKAIRVTKTDVSLDSSFSLIFTTR